MMHRVGTGAALLLAGALAQTQEELDAYPDYAYQMDLISATWEAVKVKTDDGYTLTMFHITGTEDGPVKVTKPAVIL